MTRRIRFSIEPDTLPTAPDHAPGVHYGVLDGDLVHEVPSLLASGRGRSHPREQVRLLPPCAPSKIVCVGRNYPEHARELGNEVPAEPLLFLKPPSSLIAHGDEIEYPDISQRVDYEGELGVVIGRRGRRIPRAAALDHVLGYTVVNDVTARDLQKKDGQFTRGKGFDTFCAVGPHLVPRDEVTLDRLSLRTMVDGEPRQDGLVREMMFGVDAIIEYVSQVMTLEPGDLIATGTPPGVGPLTRGAVVTVFIDDIESGEELGSLTNRVR